MRDIVTVKGHQLTHPFTDPTANSGRPVAPAVCRHVSSSLGVIGQAPCLVFASRTGGIEVTRT